MTSTKTQQSLFPANTPDAVFSPSILLVDGKPQHLASILALLEEYPSETAIATSGLEAFRLLRKGHFDLILLDLDLPDLEGYVLMDFISKQAFNPDIIVLSATTEANAASQAYRRGAYRFLKKPYSPEELLQDVRNALSKRFLEAENRSISLQLRYSEQLYRSLVNHVPDIVCTLNEGGQITFINESVTTLLGYLPDELSLQHYSRLVHPPDLERATAVFDHRTEPFLQTELRLCTKEEAHPASFLLTLMNLQFSISSMHQVKGTYLIARDISDNKRAEEIISFHANYDALTSLPNRALLKEKLDAELQHAKKYQVGLTILFIDLDRFKLINDSLGHAKGDFLLKQVAARLKEIARYSDIVARLGSDEFVLAMPGLSDPKRVQDIATRCAESLGAPFEIAADKEKLTITASIGIAMYPEDGTTVEELIGNADIAMSHVKTQGKNGILFYNQTMARAPHILSHERALRRALERNELEMYYQPQVDLASGKIIGAEALMRWNHPERGLLAAGEFLPLAEENGLIIPMTEWMLEAVCYDIHIAKTLKKEIVPISINLSPQYIDRCDCPRKIQGALKRHSISPGLFQVEITENICIRNPANAIIQLNELNDIGVDISIDDFGTGYSSLAYLHRFPIQTIKVDRSFVSEINDPDGDYPVVLAIISIAQGLDMTLIAEGVETEIQAQYLQKWGCHIMQGYLYHKPLPLKHLLELLV
ncbi:EAL domain-containing protein [Oxalobacter vibrioformis]|uniref:EAL domain-containing protein n=1 Tax=Oxalobacter vibrioformis TaxID=933080 RepID=A0A9E9P2X4_9BURK|nr:EAL domain-containing protein [Oxalobacter vibrioformis]WAW09448.1 EAL domain-containing protein [Oxalobacter vibrioformis]